MCMGQVDWIQRKIGIQERIRGHRDQIHINTRNIKYINICILL